MFPARGKVVTFADSCSLRAVLPPDGAFWREGPGGGGGPEADLDLIQGVCSLPLSLGRRQVSPCVRLNTSCRCVCRVTDFRRVTSTLQHCPARGWVGGLLLTGVRRTSEPWAPGPPQSSRLRGMWGPGRARLCSPHHMCTRRWGSRPSGASWGPRMRGTGWPYSLWARGGLGRSHL